MNFFNQGIPLGRWFGITVVIHWTFLLYAAQELLPEDGSHIGIAVLGMCLLFGTVLVHEFGHALSCRAVGGEAFHIVLWPLGGLAFVQPPMRPWPSLVTTVCGPLVNAIMWPLFWYLSNHWPFPVPDKPGTLYMTAYASCWYMWQINKGLLLFNLIPAYPMDGGRILQELLWMTVGYRMSLKIAGMVGTVAGVSFIALGLGFFQVQIPGLGTLGKDPSWTLAVIGLLGAIQSFAIYKRAEEIREWRKN